MKKFLVAFFLLLTPLFVVLPVFAKEKAEHVVLDKDQVINKDYFAAGEAVTVLGTINGDAYIAGGNILVEGDINGDLIVVGGTITIRGNVSDDIRVAGGNITISSNVGKNITVAGGNIMIAESANIGGSLVAAGGSITQEAKLGRGATLAGGQVTIANEVNGDVWAGVGQLTLTPNAKVNGDLHYVSDSEVSVLTGATVAGSISREEPPAEFKTGKETSQKAASGFGAMFRIVILLSTLVLGLLLIKFAPRLMENVTQTVAKAPWKALAIGLVSYCVFPFVFILLLVTIIGIPFAFIFLALMFITAYISKIFVALFVGLWIIRKMNGKYGQYVALAIGLIVYFLLGSIPVIGALTFMAFLFIGTGALLLTKQSMYRELRSKNYI